MTNEYGFNNRKEMFKHFETDYITGTNQLEDFKKEVVNELVNMEEGKAFRLQVAEHSNGTTGINGVVVYVYVPHIGQEVLRVGVKGRTNLLLELLADY